MVISKPIGMLSVPGKSDKSSVYSVIKERYNIETPLLVHRLDMDTSGLLVIAKSIEIYKNLQKQFINREVKKRYRAILDGIIDKKSGQISLNMCADIYDRPKQMVVMQGGKEAITNYKVVEEIELNIGENHKRCTVVDFYPITGRTHQLRVHSAHHMGLNCPILGDPLYGIRADRMYLHATEIIFNHPVTQNKIELVLAPQF
jgi:tRNA pseudouridine32 synthase/23S rRNA pseudouridine746 synthase